MMAKAEQLSEIYNKNMILQFDDTESKTGKLVFYGGVQDQNMAVGLCSPNR